MVEYIFNNIIPLLFIQGKPSVFSMGVGTALRRTEWWIGFHSTFIKSAAKEMGRYVSMNRGKVRV